LMSLWSCHAPSTLKVPQSQLAKCTRMTNSVADFI
jgi:hypothetical protein